MLGPQGGFGQLIDISDEEARDNLARASVTAPSFLARSARGIGKPPVSQREVDRATSIPERVLIRWRGEADPRHVEAIDAYWMSAAHPRAEARRPPDPPHGQIRGAAGAAGVGSAGLTHRQAGSQYPEAGRG
jgi:hypothetical protein